MTRSDVCKLKNSSCVATAAVALTVLAFPATGLASTLDQQCTPPRPTGVEPFWGGDYAQSFRAGISGPLEKASFYLTTYGGSVQAQIELRAVDGAGMPTGSALATSSQVTASDSFPTSATDFVFPTPANVTAGQSYALVGTGSATQAMRRCTDDTYANGTYLANFSGWSEVSPGEDMTFATYIGTSTGGGGSQPPPGVTPPSTQTPSVTTDFPKANGKYRRKQFKSISGTVTNAGSVKEVKISVKRKSGKRCRWLSRRGMKRRSCSKPVWLRARGVKSWKARISKRQRRALKPGSYTLLVRLDDASGNQMSASGRTSVRFRVRK